MRCIKPLSTTRLHAKIRFNPFHSVPLGTLHFAILRYHKRRIVDQYWWLRSTCSSSSSQIVRFDVDYSLQPVGNRVS